MARVQDIVDDRELFHVAEGRPVAEVSGRMADLHVGAILVLDGNQLRGLFSERDLMKRVVVEGLNPEQTKVGKVMSRNLATIDESATLEEAMEAMQRHNCRHLPVMRADRVV